MWDCIIVGGGPAGLTAATYLARFRRNALLVDAGESRLRRVPLSHNVPGFPDGVAGRELHARLRRQAQRYGAALREGRIRAAQRDGEFFCLALGEETLLARTILLATGARLVEPAVEGAEQALQQGLIRYCPICDGFEAQDRRIAVLGGRAGAIAEAIFLRTYSDRVSYFWLDGGAPTPEERAVANAKGVAVAGEPTTQVRVRDRYVELLNGSRVYTADVVYPSLGCHPASELARQLGAALSSEGGVKVDALQQTSAPLCYAAGDVLQGLDQIASACGQAAIAAVAIHNALSA